MKSETRSLDLLNLALDPAAPLSLQLQLRQKLVDAIHRGVLRPDQRLPSSRHLAARIGVSRNTVSLTYDALLAEGHLVSRPRSGIYIAPGIAAGRIGTRQRAVEPTTALAARLPAIAEDSGFRCPQHWHRYPFPFIDGRVDAELTPVAEWREALRLAGSRHELQQWNLDAGDGDDPLLAEEIRGKVLPMRGIQAGADELLMALSCRHALQLAGELLVRRGTPVVLEQPADPEFERRMRERHADISTLDPELRQPLPPGAVVVGSGRRAFAAGSPQPRRLLAALAAADAVLIEHDVPPDVPSGERVAPALRAFDQDGRVIHIASLSPVVACGEPPAVLVAANAFIERARQLRRNRGTTLPWLVQRSWAYFIGMGHYSAALVRAGRLLAERRTALRDALNHYLHEFVAIDTTPGASAYDVNVPAGMDARELARRAAGIGVLVEPLQLGEGRQVLRMGVTGIAAAQIREGVRTLSRLVRGDLAPATRRIEDDLPPLRGKALRRAMTGAHWLYSTVYGEPCTLEIRADGTLAGTAGYAGEDCDHGHWWIEDDRWYRQWRQWAYGEAAGYALVLDGDRLRLYGEDGLLADTAVLTRSGRARNRD
ncbi:MAG: PLP-dependent aminotransferase family protein [Stenotrophomonas sp.]